MNGCLKEWLSDVQVKVFQYPINQADRTIMNQIMI